jgi:hypothetical protein
MYLCYIDESGTPDVPGNTSHFILAGVSIPVADWRGADKDVSKILARYGLVDHELHTAWMLRKYIEQSRIPNFSKLNWDERRRAVTKERTSEILKLQQNQSPKSYKQAKKNYNHTTPYIHLTYEERVSAIREVADLISG